MIRPVQLALSAVCLSAAPLVAQQPTVRRVGGNAQLVAYIPNSGAPLSGTPKSYSDSVLNAWAREVPDFPAVVQAHLAPGTRATLILRLLRNGDLHRARLEGSIGDRTGDSLLLAAVHTADEGLRFPAFSAAMPGAGTEVQIVVATPIPRNNGTTQAPPQLDLPPLSAACAESLAAPTSFRRTVLGIGVDPVTGDERRRNWAQLTMQALADGWSPVTRAVPDQAPSFFRGRPDIPDGSVMVAGWLRLQLDGTGRLLAVSVPGTTHYPVVDSALIAAAWRVDSTRAYPPPPSTRADTATVDLEVSEGGLDGTGRIILGNAEVATWEIQRVPRIVSAGRLRYPTELRRRRIGGRVDVEFVVGVDGRPVPASLRILTTPHNGFVPAVAEAIIGSRYEPATIRGCPIPALVRQGVNFNP